MASEASTRSIEELPAGYAACLLVVLLALVASGLGGRALPRDAALPANVGVRRCRGELDVLLTVHPHKERRHVHKLLADANVALLDEHASVVDGLGEPLLENLGLQPAFEELLGGELQHEIKLLLLLAEETIPDHLAQKGRALEETLRVLHVEGKELAGSLTDLGEGELHAPDLALTPESVLAA
eukprot:CAMPEP_0182588526 /NCGR_PEP_ID=MMETSP1324-20130603/67424_1 /TAXON_ID=236786 /ORGANISM="Florenciella sp., Strain RCC1587" /LENGTH=183 /DNA_ID=CAMNT_0024805601 /DNA_START=151 /DNA_END=702 /DNA_ORIENTATION=-